MNTQSPTTEAGREWLLQMATGNPSLETVFARSILAIEEAARVKGRREAVREIERRFQNEAQRHNGREYYYDVRQVNAILDEVAALNASESPHAIPTCDGVVTVNGCPKCGAYASESPPTAVNAKGALLRDLDRLMEIIVGVASNADYHEGKDILMRLAGFRTRKDLKAALAVGDASESVQPPESHGDE